MPQLKYVNDYVKDEVTGLLVHRYSIITTSTVVHEVLELLGPSYTGTGHDHTTICTVDGVWYGAYLSRELPPEIDRLPRGEKRSAYAESWRSVLKEEARAVITRVHPYTAAFPSDFMGRIDTQLTDIS